VSLCQKVWPLYNVFFSVILTVSVAQAPYHRTLTRIARSLKVLTLAKILPLGQPPCNDIMP
jgi:hypothetical protein